MKFNDGAEVYAADGTRLGDLDRVVLDPQTWEVTDIVVHKGFLFSTDKVIPIEDVQQTLEHRVTLVSKVGSKEYPDFVDNQFIPLVQEDEAVFEQPSPMLWYPPFSPVMVNAAPTANPYLVHKTWNIPENTEGLRIGSRVVTSDGHHVGHVHELFMESMSNQASHILVSKGLLLPAEKLVPMSWVRSVSDDEIRLTVGEKMVMSLPDYNATP